MESQIVMTKELVVLIMISVLICTLVSEFLISTFPIIALPFTVFGMLGVLGGVLTYIGNKTQKKNTSESNKQ
jgi:hypothetical protein